MKMARIVKLNVARETNQSDGELKRQSDTLQTRLPLEMAVINHYRNVVSHVQTDTTDVGKEHLDGI